MFYPLRTVSEEPFPLRPADLTLDPAAHFLALMHQVNELFDETPTVLHIPGDGMVTLLYRDVACRWRDLLDGAGAEAAALSVAVPLWFSGTTPDRETAQLTLRREERGFTVCRSSLSGREFDRLQGLGVQVDWPEVDAAAHVAALAAGLSAGAPCGAFGPEHRDFLRRCGLLAPTAGSCFAYFSWGEFSPRQFLMALSMEQKAGLWRSFLEDGQQYKEFEWLWEDYAAGETVYLLEWELALRAVLEDLGFRLERDELRFQVLDGKGEVRRFDFDRGGPAEKLFLKILFPIDTKETGRAF